MEGLVKPELKAEFEADKCNWFSRTDTPEHKAYDKRTPGLFKVLWEGPITVLGPKISFLAKGLTRNVTR